MNYKTILLPHRVRKISGSFAFVEHRFLQGGFWQSLSSNELLLYFFLVLASDRFGISFYGYDRITTLLRICLDDYIQARDGLIKKDLIAFDGHFFQVLSLPEAPVFPPARLLKTHKDMLDKDPATIHRTICEALGTDPDEIPHSRQPTIPIRPGFASVYPRRRWLPPLLRGMPDSVLSSISRTTQPFSLLSPSAKFSCSKPARIRLSRI